jgi:hypothetical protein
MQERLSHEAGTRAEHQKRVENVEAEFDRERVGLEERVEEKERHLALLKAEFEAALG